MDDKIIQAGMFNDNASDLERQNKLQELIRRGNEDSDEESAEKDEESEIPTFEMINEMLARSPEEVELFNKMDEEMGQRENKQARIEEILKHKPNLNENSRINYRLTQEWEVPDWIKVKPVDTEKERENMLNLGKRQRKTIINLDNLSDQQFLRAVEEGEDLQEVMKRV